MYRPTIGLDFGSAYTKLAYRPPFPHQKQGKFASQETDVLSFGQSTCIPTVVIYTGQKRSPWLCGTEAAGVNPGKNWEVFTNWKSDIFSAGFNDNEDELEEIAVVFFTWLLKKTRSPYVNVSPKTRIRISVPSLRNISRQKTFLRNCMRESGWSGSVEFVEEPVANAAGTFSGGKNYITATGSMSYGPMFGQHLSREINLIFHQARRYLVEKVRPERYLTLAIVDCGGFTLDVAKLKLDLKVTEYAGLPFQVISSVSKKIGVVRQIDEIALSGLFELHGVEQDSISFEAMELAKYDLYAAKPHNLFVGKHILELGRTTEDTGLIAGAIERYCSKAWEGLSMYDWTDVEYVILTGGGSNINRIRKHFELMLSGEGVATVMHISGDNPVEGNANKKPGYLSERDYSKVFGRVATALGDASIALGYESA